MVHIDTQILTVTLIAGIVLLSGVLSSRLSYRLGVPALVLFVIAGMIMGRWYYFDDAWLAQLVGTIALVVILFNGGLETEWKQMRKVLFPAGLLATLGVVVTAALTGLITWWLLDIDLPSALLIGAIVGSTDAAATFAVLGNHNLPPRLRYLLEAESGMNDPMAVFLTLMMIDWIKTGPPTVLEALGFVIWQMGLGVAAGLAVGRLLAWLLPRLRMQNSSLYSIFLTAVALALFGVVSWLNGSGFMAVYILGIYVATIDIPYQPTVMRFHQGLAWIAQITMFTLLGLLVFPSELLPVIVPGLLISIGLAVVARPVAVWLLTLGMGFELRERILIAWAGLRGAVPIILATYPLLAGVPESNMVFNIVFFVVMTSAFVEGSGIGPVARWLGLLEEGAPPTPVTLELIAMEKLNVDMVEVELSENSRGVGRRLAELNLPEYITVSAIYRNGRVVTPRGSTVLLAGDVLFMLAPKEKSNRIRAIWEKEASAEA